MIERDPAAPCLRLFLSVDIQGSTAFKYDQANRESFWLGILHRFFSSFPATFYRCWERAIRHAREDGLPDFPGQEPQFWKSAGDELLFVKVLSHPIQCVTSLVAFKAALAEHDQVVKRESGERLRLKGTAWVAGFPNLNIEVPIATAAKVPAHPSDEIEYRAAIARSTAAMVDLPAHQRDYVGPSIDIGFRLSRRASPRRLILSVELALIVAEDLVQVGDDKVLGLQYEEGDILKGVLNNTTYPTIWIDMNYSIPPTSPVDHLLKRQSCDLGQLISACRDFISISPPLVLPYIVEEANVIYGSMPDDHSAKLSLIRDRLARENQKEKEFLASETQEERGDATAADIDIERIVIDQANKSNQSQ